MFLLKTINWIWCFNQRWKHNQARWRRRLILIQLIGIDISLSTLKKYKVNRLCVINLKEKAFFMLGHNTDKDWRCIHESQQRERCQIDEAVHYYRLNQTKYINNRTLMTTHTNTRTKWEVDMRHAMNDNKYTIKYHKGTTHTYNAYIFNSISPYTCWILIPHELSLRFILIFESADSFSNSRWREQRLIMHWAINAHFVHRNRAEQHWTFVPYTPNKCYYIGVKFGSKETPSRSDVMALVNT